MKIFGSSEAFLVGDEIEWEVVDEGVKRKITGYDALDCKEQISRSIQELIHRK